MGSLPITITELMKFQGAWKALASGTEDMVPGEQYRGAGPVLCGRHGDRIEVCAKEVGTVH